MAAAVVEPDPGTPRQGSVPAVERIRLATPDDVVVLTRRHQHLVGLSYEWADRLGDGSSADADLALVAEVGGHVVADVGVGPFVVAQSRVIYTDGHAPGGSPAHPAAVADMGRERGRTHPGRPGRHPDRRPRAE